MTLNGRVMKNMNGEPILPTDEGFGDPEQP